MKYNLAVLDSVRNNLIVFDTVHNNLRQSNIYPQTARKMALEGNKSCTVSFVQWGKILPKTVF
jgi:hypothetical protein